jgi:regulatory protein
LLQRGYPSAVIEKTLAKLLSFGYVNDESFARTWALSRVENLGYGPKKIERDLRTKGIRPPLIQNVVGEIFSQTDETARARLVLAKRFKHKELSGAGILRRAVAFLQRRGYSDKVIFALLKLPVEQD